jgi:hypothetical protein
MLLLTIYLEKLYCTGLVVYLSEGVSVTKEIASPLAKNPEEGRDIGNDIFVNSVKL